MRWLTSLSLLLSIGCSTFLPGTSSHFEPPKVPAGLLTALSPYPSAIASRYAAIIGLNTEDRHRGNISLAYQVLIESGFKRDHIFILDPSTTSPIFPKTDTTSFASVRLLMSRLAEIIGDRDELIVYVTGHGRLIDDEPHLVLNPSEFMASREFLASLDAIRPGRGLVIFDQCYWGPELHPSSCRWATITVAKPSTESTGNMFPRQLWYALREGFSVDAAFGLASITDANTMLGENDPRYLPRSCGIEKAVAGVIQF